MKRAMLYARVVLEGAVGFLLIPNALAGLAFEYQRYTYSILVKLPVVTLGVLMVIDANRISKSLKKSRPG